MTPCLKILKGNTCSKASFLVSLLDLRGIVQDRIYIYIPLNNIFFFISTSPKPEIPLSNMTLPTSDAWLVKWRLGGWNSTDRGHPAGSDRIDPLVNWFKSTIYGTYNLQPTYIGVILSISILRRWARIPRDGLFLWSTENPICKNLNCLIFQHLPVHSLPLTDPL